MARKNKFILFATICVLMLTSYFIFAHKTTATTTHFQLTDDLGKEFTEKNLQGRWTLMFFGFTHCGMVCPATMSALNTMYQTLQKTLPKDELPQVVFVSIDTQRDTVKRLHEFIQAYNTHFIGVRAEKSETEKLMQQLHIISAKMQAKNGNYTLDHTADIFVFNPNGELHSTLAYPHRADQLGKDYKNAMLSFKPDTEFRDTTNHSIQLSKLRGNWVVINYWAAWCHSCVEEIPELNRFYQHNQNKAVRFFGVNFDNLPPADLKLTMNKFNIHFPVMTHDPSQAWGLGEVTALPAIFIINPQGKLVKKMIGSNTEKSLATTLTKLQHAN